MHRIINVQENKTLRPLAIGIVRLEPERYTISTRPAPYELALDNDRVRAWRLRLNPGEGAPAIQQSRAALRYGTDMRPLALIVNMPSGGHFV